MLFFHRVSTVCPPASRYLCLRQKATLDEGPDRIASLRVLMRKALAAQEQRPELSLEEAAEDLPVALDYTIVLKEKSYAEDIEYFLDSLWQQGYKIQVRWPWPTTP